MLSAMVLRASLSGRCLGRDCSRALRLARARRWSASPYRCTQGVSGVGVLDNDGKIVAVVKMTDVKV